MRLQPIIKKGFNMTVGERIRNRRIELGMSQDELAKKVGYKSRSSVNKIEMSRDLPLTKVQKMANALDVSPGFLMGWEDEVDVPLPSEVVQGAQKAIIDMLNDDSQAQRVENMIRNYLNCPEQIRETIDMLLKSSQQLPESQERTHNTE